MTSHACPHAPSAGPDRRKSARAGERERPPVEEVDGVWVIRSLDAARTVLRDAGATTQAGFSSEHLRHRFHAPVLFLDGPEHRRQRTRIARFFTPKTVASRYRDFMEVRADELVARAAELGEFDLGDLAMRFAVEVTAEVIGLGDADMPGMSRRLDAFFRVNQTTPVEAVRSHRSPWARAAFLARAALGQSHSVARLRLFQRHDVRPAVAERRRERRDDVISYLIDEGYSDSEILIECVTYGAAGMVTTRQFITMAVWHLLEDADLRERYVTGDEATRRAILSETLRLEPVVGHLYRRAVKPVTVEADGRTVTIPEGALIDLQVRQANADPDAVVPDPLDLCPGRSMPPRTYPEGVSFGDGHHRCPGNHLAMLESDILLQRLLRLPLAMVGTPRIEWDELIAGYEIEDLRLRVTRRIPL